MVTMELDQRLIKAYLDYFNFNLFLYYSFIELHFYMLASYQDICTAKWPHPSITVTIISRFQMIFYSIVLFFELDKYKMSVVHGQAGQVG